MQPFIQEQLSFVAAIFLTLFVPGLFALRLFFRRSFTALELFVFSVPVSLAVLNFLMIGLGKSGVALSAHSIECGIAGICLVFVAVSLVFRKSLRGNDAEQHTPLPFSIRQVWLIILILGLTLFIKTLYLSQVILPTATDLGHHMYWSKSIAVTGELPTYVERNIVEENGAYRLDDPEPIDDFIIGEHLVFAAIALIAGLDFVSGFPAEILLLINVFTVLAIFLFTVRAFSGLGKIHGFSSDTAGIVALLFLGPIYTLASPQAKFVSGGVIGNTMGNLFIPTVLYCYWRALHEKSSKFLTLAFFLTFGLAYIHHLSTLIFLFIFFFAVVTFSLLHIRDLGEYAREWMRLALKPAPIAMAIAAILFFSFILAPSYADPKSLNTAIGSPVKATRTGLTFLQFTFSTGEGRLGLGLVGLLILIFFHLRKKPSDRDESYSIVFFFAWGFAILLMSLRPQWLFLDIPSNRISSYAVFPFAVLSALAVTILFANASKSMNRSLAAASCLVMITFFLSGGFYDNSQSLLGKTKAQEAIETYRASDYLASHDRPNNLILKDHNYIVADSWMKLSFLKGYTYPLSRGYFKRYEDETSPREQCTLWMISVPNSDKGKKCFDETGTNVVVVNPRFDSAQFKNSPEFVSIYQSNNIAAYVRKVPKK